jgi:uncharacterized protein YdgA (DUF945 family)
MGSRTTKFALWSLVVGGCAAALGASWYTVKSVDEHILATIEDINHSGVMRASWYPKSSLLFSRDGVLHLVFLNQHMRQNLEAQKIDSSDPESLREVQDSMSDPLTEEQQKPAEIFINISNSVLPLMLSGDATLDMSKGSMANLVRKHVVPASLPMKLNWKYTAYNQAIDLHLTMDEWLLEHADSAVKVGAASATLIGDLKDTLELNYGWEGMKVNGKPADQNSMEIMPLEGNSLLSRFAGMWMSPEGHSTLAGMRFSTPEAKGEMGKLQFDAAVEESPSETGVALNLKQHIALTNLSINTPQNKLTLDDLSLGINLTGLNKLGMEELAQFTESKTPDFMQMMKSLNKITTRSIRLELSPLSVKLNRALLTASGKLETLPFEVEQLMRAGATDADPFKHLVQGDLTITAEPAIVSSLPVELQTSVAALQQQAFIQLDDQKRMSSHLLLRNGDVTVNGKLLPTDQFNLQGE